MHHGVEHILLFDVVAFVCALICPLAQPRAGLSERFPTWCEQQPVKFVSEEVWLDETLRFLVSRVRLMRLIDVLVYLRLQ